MKIKNSPKHLQNVPNNYKLDVGDYQSINKYRTEKAIKNRLWKYNMNKMDLIEH